MKVSIQNLTKAYGGHDLLRDFSLELHAGVRLAVTGPNGAGKSTFLRILAGAAQPDAGRVSMPKGARLGYVAQELDEEDLAAPLLDWVLEVLPSWADFWRDWEKAQDEDNTEALAALSRRQVELEQTYGYNPEHRAHAVLTGLGFEPEKHAALLSTFSGGWRERAKLARVLVAGADVLLLDEPTNHLDLEAVEWLESFLLDFAGVLVFVAHDRVFLDRVGKQVLFLGGSKPIYRTGTFDEFLAWQEEYEEQRQREAKKLSAELEKKMDFVRRFKAKATKARQAASKKKQALRIERELDGLIPERKRKTLSFKWPEPKRGDKITASAVGLQAEFRSGGPLWPPLDFNIFRGQKIAVAGPNGCGKSTLLKMLVGKLEPTAGYSEIGSNTSLGYFSQHQLETLSMDKTVLAQIRSLADPRTTEEELMSVLGLFMLGEKYFDRQVGSLSGGEKSRLALAALFLARANFLVLDEPTNHLDLESREALVDALESFPGTLLLVAHDRWLLSEVAEVVWELGEDGMTVHEDGFAGYERSRLCEAPEETDDGAAAQQPSSLTREEAKRIKRAQAERRNAVYKQLKPKQDRYDALEKELEAVGAKLSETEKTLADPEIYADAAKMTPLLQKYKDLQDRSEKLLEEMTSLEEDIQLLEKERETLAVC